MSRCHELQMFFLVHPNCECFFFIEENSATRWVEAISVCCFQNRIVVAEQDVMLCEHLLEFFVHAFRWIKLSFQIQRHALGEVLNLSHDFFIVIHAHDGVERVAFNRTSGNETNGDHVFWVQIGQLAWFSPFAFWLLVFLLITLKIFN